MLHSWPRPSASSMEAETEPQEAGVDFMCKTLGEDKFKKNKQNAQSQLWLTVSACSRLVVGVKRLHVGCARASPVQST